MPANPGVIGAEPLMDAYGYMIPFVLVKNGGGGMAANSPLREGYLKCLLFVFQEPGPVVHTIAGSIELDDVTVEQYSV